MGSNIVCKNPEEVQYQIKELLLILEEYVGTSYAECQQLAVLQNKLEEAKMAVLQFIRNLDGQIERASSEKYDEKQYEKIQEINAERNYWYEQGQMLERLQEEYVSFCRDMNTLYQECYEIYQTSGLLGGKIHYLMSEYIKIS